MEVNIQIDEFDIKDINREHWKHAKGIKAPRTETNSCLANRDYSVECRLRKICIIKGYHIWWCSVHHQPASICDLDQKDNEIKTLEEKIEKIKEITKN